MNSYRSGTCQEFRCSDCRNSWRLPLRQKSTTTNKERELFDEWNCLAPRLQSRPQNKFDAAIPHIHAMGSIVLDAGVVFRVWAPHADEVHVVGNFIEWQADANPMQREDSGNWLAIIESVKPGGQYKHEVTNRERTFQRIDLGVREVTNSIGNGIVYDPNFDWQNNAYLTKSDIEGGAGFSTQWDAKFVHPIREVLTQVDDAGRDMNKVRDALHRAPNLNAFQRVVYTESHDEVANGKSRIPSEFTKPTRTKPTRTTPIAWWNFRRVAASKTAIDMCLNWTTRERIVG